MRINVTGNAGSGKTTLAQSLAAELMLPMYSLDSIVWQTGWVKTPPDERNRAERALVARENWVIDGVSKHVRDSADLVVYLDVPRHVCLWRCIVRGLRYFRRTRPELPPGCPEISVVPRLLGITRRFSRGAGQDIRTEAGREPSRFRIVRHPVHLKELARELVAWARTQSANASSSEGIVQYQYQKGDVLVVVDEWKGDSRVAPVLSYGARAFFDNDLSPLFAALGRAEAGTWHARAPRSERGFLFNSARFEEVLDYLESAPTRLYGMLRDPEQFTAAHILDQAAAARASNPVIAELLPDNAQALGLFWFLDRLLHRLLEAFPNRPIRVFLDTLDWRAGAPSHGAQSALRPYGASKHNDVCVYEIVEREDPELSDISALLGVVDSELWAFGRFQCLSFPDGSTPRSRMIEWQASRHNNPVWSSEEEEYACRIHKDHAQLISYWSRLTPWLRSGRTEVINERESADRERAT